MAIWEISFDPDTFQHLVLSQRTHAVLQQMSDTWFQGALIGDAWIPLTVAVSRNHLPGDFPSLGGIPLVFSDRAVQTLLPLIGACVEILPLVCATAGLAVVNVTKVLDCLDHTQSHVARFSTGRIMRVEKYIFRAPCVHQAPLFKLPEQIRNRHYVSDAFKTMVEVHHLRGMVFQQVA